MNDWNVKLTPSAVPNFKDWCLGTAVVDEKRSAVALSSVAFQYFAAIRPNTQTSTVFHCLLFEFSIIKSDNHANYKGGIHWYYVTYRHVGAFLHESLWHDSNYSTFTSYPLFLCLIPFTIKLSGKHVVVINYWKGSHKAMVPSNH